MSSRIPLRACFAALAFVWVEGCVTFHEGHVEGAPADSRFITVEGARLRVAVTGEGPAIILIHGFASSLETWDLVRPFLSGFRVVTLDLAGFGYSDRKDGDYYSPRAEARLVRGVMEQLGIDSASIVAHSWGASIALALALESPERVERLALYDAWVYAEQLPSFFHWARLPGVGEALFGVFYDQLADERLTLGFYRPETVPEELVEKVLASLERPGTFAAALAAARGQRFDDLEARYREIGVPVLLLWGREDRVSTVAVAERLAQDLRGARLIVYPRTGHFPMLEVPGASTRDLVAFLGEGRP
ncbi:MAG: alpha/beta hydrolase [Deltaproteobacteria bacterium]|nr:alpha/beta hydrolase [Deltaproteobacteria bacterium]